MTLEHDDQITEAIQEIQSLGLHIEGQGHPAGYVGVNIRKLKSIAFTYFEIPIPFYFFQGKSGFFLNFTYFAS